MRLTYFHEEAPLDVDNMIKPIQDALIGISFIDDSQVRDVQASLRDLNGTYLMRGIGRALAEGFMSNEPFVHIRIETAKNPKELP